MSNPAHGTREPSGRPRNGRHARQSWLWAGFALLFVAGVPWYFPASTERLFLGLPLWVQLCLLGNLALAIFGSLAIPRLWD